MKQRDKYESVRIPEGNRCPLPKGLNCKKLNEGTICGSVVRIKGIDKRWQTIQGQIAGARRSKKVITTPGVNENEAFFKLIDTGQHRHK